MGRLECRLLVLERTHKPPARYALPLPPDGRRLCALVLRGPSEQTDLAAARAGGYAAELDTPENNARFVRMTTLNRRLQALEGTTDSHAKPLPTVVPDDTPAEELERLRRGGREVYRWRDAVELFV